MKFNNCDVVKDLLPSYNDNLLSETSSKLVEEHLKICENCRKELMYMSKDIPMPKLEQQKEEIDYLRGYKKNKIRTVGFAILMTINIFIMIFIILFIYNDKTEYSYPIEQLNFIYKETVVSKGENRLIFTIENIKHDFKLVEHRETDENNNTIIFLKFIGKFPLIPEMEIGSHSLYDFVIDDTVNKIYLENDEGNLIEVWRKSK